MKLHWLSVWLILTGMTTMIHAGQFVPADDPHIQYMGRWDFSDPLHPKHSWPGVYVQLNFTGTSIGVRTSDTVNYFNITIDGQPAGIFHGDKPGESDYLLAENLADTVHTLRFSKRNTSFNEIFSIAGFLIDDGAALLDPPKRSSNKIEFLGDSFTAAEGNEATEPQIPWEATKAVTNIDLGFAPLIAKHFDAEYHTTCRSGIGMFNDWQGDRDLALPKRFDQTLMEVEIPQWDFSQFVPDLAMICLGLNDYSGFNGWNGPVSDENSALFRTAYHAFIHRIRNAYPNVKILAVAAHVPWIREQVKQVVAEENEEGYGDIFYAQFDEFPGGYVANGHPTVETHRKIADQIIQAIEEAGIFSE